MFSVDSKMCFVYFTINGPYSLYSTLVFQNVPYILVFQHVLYMYMTWVALPISKLKKTRSWASIFALLCYLLQFGGKKEKPFEELPKVLCRTQESVKTKQFFRKM